MKTLSTFTHVNAKSIDEAVSLLAKGKADAIAGGTDLIGTLRFRILREYPKTIVNLKSIPGLDYIKEEGGMLKIGALTRLEDIATSGVVKSKYAALAEAAAKTASPHLREVGTIAGNICQLNRCWYFRKEENRFDCLRKGGSMCFAMAGDNRFHSIFGAVKACIAVNPSDTAPALVVLNTKIKTNKRTIEADKFWDASGITSTVLASDEIVTEIQVPTPVSGIKSAFLKMAQRKSIDFPIVNCAAAIGGGEARICLNAVHNMPYRAVKAENSIKGKIIDELSASTAGDASVEGAMALAYNKWKIQIAKTLVKRAVLACK
jgi:xanthine dehydrogenase YagS FAD-binding subunit